MTLPLDKLPNALDFTWRDGPRVVRFGAGALDETTDLLANEGWERFELLSTERALAGAPLGLVQAAAAVHQVPAGKVADTSAGLLDAVTTPSLVALGGGRVIDTAKAIAAVRGGRVAAVPTTLSGAEMTRFHRLPEGHSAPHLVRPVLVAADPKPMTGLPDMPLRATAMNALAHGADALFAPLANPFSTQAGLEGAALIASALDAPDGPGVDPRLALGSLFCAHAIDGAGFSLHHALCQELVRGLGMAHAETNATMLPHTMGAMVEREPVAMAALAEAIGAAADGLFDRLAELGGGGRHLGELGGDRAALDTALDAVHSRVASMMADPPTREELATLVEAAW